MGKFMRMRNEGGFDANVNLCKNIRKTGNQL
jgi:hypothetical protein